ncbi:SE1626 family protein [Staphylococcus simulans]
MKHLTKIFVIIAIITFLAGVYFQKANDEGASIKMFLAAIMFMICAFISRNNDRKKREQNRKK